MPPLLEQLGALGSLVIHDFANQICIISGNATFAQMMLADPQQVGRAVEAITRAGEHMSFILNQCADLRRRVSAQLPRGDGRAAACRIEAFFRGQPGWRTDVRSGLEGALRVPTDWVAFAAEQTLSAIEQTGGVLRIQRAQVEADGAVLPGDSGFEVRFLWRSHQPFSIDDLRKRYERLGLLAAFELVRQCGGKLEGFTPAAGEQQVLLYVPYASDEAARPGAAPAGAPVCT